jgi:microtubule-associated protein-like 6
MVTGDDFGFVKLFRYPSYEEKSGYIKYIGHSAQVTNARFTMAEGL